MVKIRDYAVTGRTVHKFGKGSRWCKRCGDYNAVIQKYDLDLYYHHQNLLWKY
ncbi:MAG: hypothetical protein HYR87_06715 [Thaumarchaeota archaeon]|nr:hypothetical protein [Nitrososphaerota archaeon]